MPIMSELLPRPEARDDNKIAMLITDGARKKIQEGKFIEMGELLLKKEEQRSPASAFLHAVGVADISATEPKFGKLRDAQVWAKAFAKFKYFHTQFYPDEARALDAYMYHVLDLAGDGADWEMFDTDFRRERAAATFKRAWNDHHGYLYTKAYAKASRGGVPFRGKGGSSWGKLPLSGGQGRKGRNFNDAVPNDFCKLHHSGKGCHFGAKCRYDHACPKCKQDHPLSNHPNGRSDNTQRKKQQ